MEDTRIWEFEESLWIGDAGTYHELIDDECIMVLPSQPHVITGQQAIEAVSDTPRWQEVTFSDRSVVRPEEGLIVIAYHAEASKQGDEVYKAWCSTTLRRLSHDQWRVVQHSQNIAPIATAA
jgi:Domain of unknown function (DUF4440)